MSYSNEMKVRCYGSLGKNMQIPQPGNPTYTEAWALIEAARRIAEALEHGDFTTRGDRDKMRDAIRLNWRLWTIFQAELTTNETSVVSEQLRIDMLTLCKFVDNQTLDVMASLNPDKIVALVDLNRNIAQGLLSSLVDNGDKEGTDLERTEKITAHHAPEKDLTDL